MTKQATIRYIKIEIKAHKKFVEFLDENNEEQDYQFFKGCLYTWEKILEVIKDLKENE